MGAGRECRLSVDKNMRDLFDACLAAGWSAVRKSRHVAVYSPDVSVPMVVFPGSSSDYRSVKNKRAELRRAGLEVR